MRDNKEAYARLLTQEGQRGEWNGDERRAGGNVFLELLQHNTDQTEECVKIVNDLKQQFEAHMKGEEQLLRRLVEGYPDDDPHAHRAYHEKVMRALERKEKFRDAVIEKTLAGFAWSLLLGLAAAVWQYFKDHVR